ncbi:unnamed protein product [Penicillium pancosmium]
MSEIIQIINARLVEGDSLVSRSLWIDSVAGIFVPSPDPALVKEKVVSTIDLHGRILSPGFIDLQINGAYGFDFSEDASKDAEGVSYKDRYSETRQKLIKTGTTSFLPTMTSQHAERYHQNLPFLGPSKSRSPFEGSESLGAHCEGPFFAHNRMGVHLPEAIQSSGPSSEPELVIRTYGASNLFSTTPPYAQEQEPGKIPSHVRMITMAPERPGALSTIQQFSNKGLIMSIGHMAANYTQAAAGIKAGAKMITHLYNQMNPHHHREPGPLGILGGTTDITPENETKIILEDNDSLHHAHHDPRPTRPYFGIIADGHHVHPASIRLAHLTHPEGLVLVTDALMLLGGEDGTVDWLTRRLTKKGIKVMLEGTDIIAGSCVTIPQCINNFRKWTGASIAAVLQTVTSRPASILGMENVKGSLRDGTDADFVVLSEEDVLGQSVSELVVDQVWKFGVKVFDRDLE